MAKDGTRRGGARVGAGRPRKQKPENPETVLQIVTVTDAERSSFPTFNRDLCDAKGAYSLAAAEDVYYSVYKFARDNGAEGRVPKELVELFAVTYSRWVQVEKDISKEGFTAEHPTTGAPCKSPLVDVSNTYSKQAHNYWYSIWSAIKDAEPDTDHDDMDAMLD
jgi:hypothetical protein